MLSASFSLRDSFSSLNFWHLSTSCSYSSYFLRRHFWALFLFWYSLQRWLKNLLTFSDAVRWSRAGSPSLGRLGRASGPWAYRPRPQRSPDLPLISSVFGRARIGRSQDSEVTFGCFECCSEPHSFPPTPALPRSSGAPSGPAAAGLPSPGALGCETTGTTGC